MPLNPASTTLGYAPIQFAYVATHLATRAWVFPTNRAQTQFQFPTSNTRQIVVLNTGNSPLLFGLQAYPDSSSLPGEATVGIPGGVPYALPFATYPFAVGAGPVPVEGDNCTRIPAGASFSIDLLSFEERGNFVPISTQAFGSSTLQKTAYPTYLIFFGSVGGDTTADITYVNKFGRF
jgi:hypothetical protein